MTIHKSDFLQVVKERGFFHQCTDEEGLGKVLREQSPVTAYIGFDCTAPSLHVGSLMQIMILRWFQTCGHRPIVLMGGGTTKIGDPTGKDEARKILSDEQIAANMTGIKAVFGKFLRFGSGPNDALMVNNDDWLKNINLIEFLRDYGRHFSVNRMLTMDSVKLRLEREHHLSLLEFMYMVMQAYDFVELNKLYACRLQIGGSDQWGNIINGIELNRRLDLKQAGLDSPELAGRVKQEKWRNTNPDYIKNADLFGLTTPLITTASGAKMGKTESGAVWLNADMCSPFDYWQFWRNTEDADVGKFLKFFTELPLDEIAKLEKLQGAEINEAKKILANEATKLCHGPEAATAAAETARKTFEEGGAGENLKTVFVEQAALDAGITAVDLLHLAGMKESKGEARKLIEGGGARLNDEKIADPKAKVTAAHLTADGFIKLSSGKKHHVLVKVKG
jgi:tyrosyl-tRNA synthetase